MSQITQRSAETSANNNQGTNAPRTMGIVRMKGLDRLKHQLTHLLKAGAVVLLSAGMTLNAAATEINYYHTDHLGTPKAMTDETGNVVWQATHDAFGKAEVTMGTVTNNLRFPGQYFDQETELHYNYFRTYDPNTGRYITSDPIGLDGGINTYAYVGNNPLVLSDPTGEGPVAAGACVALTVAAYASDLKSIYDAIDQANRVLDKINKLDKELETCTDEVRKTDILLELDELSREKKGLDIAQNYAKGFGIGVAVTVAGVICGALPTI